MLTDWEGHKIRNWIALVTGVFLLAISVNWVYDPAGMVTGGVTGLGISIKYLSGKFLPFEIPVWLTNLAFNLPLLIARKKIYPAHPGGNGAALVFYLPDPICPGF